jgi:hypothetical protein
MLLMLGYLEPFHWQAACSYCFAAAAAATALQDFGAIGDGVADDSQAFLDAVDAIGREGTILVPEGQYIITKQINIPNRVVIKGELDVCFLLA